jgi:hypothetical protein
MNCRQVQGLLSAYSDDRLPERERRDVAAHLDGCRRCALASQQLVRTRETLRRLPVLSPPAGLTTSLLILASRERARRLESGLGDALGHWSLRARLWAEDMMRPLALPMAGGLVSAILLFAVLLPYVYSGTASNIYDVPTDLSTGVTFRSMGPFGINDDDAIVIDVTIDPQGRMIAYSTPNGQKWVKNPAVRRSIENVLLFTVFNPGTTFGQPSPGRFRLTLRRSEIEVKG